MSSFCICKSYSHFFSAKISWECAVWSEFSLGALVNIQNVTIQFLQSGYQVRWPTHTLRSLDNTQTDNKVYVSLVLMKRAFWKMQTLQFRQDKCRLHWTYIKRDLRMSIQRDAKECSSMFDQIVTLPFVNVYIKPTLLVLTIFYFCKWQWRLLHMQPDNYILAFIKLYLKHGNGMRRPTQHAMNLSYAQFYLRMHDCLLHLTILVYSPLQL